MDTISTIIGAAAAAIVLIVSKCIPLLMGWQDARQKAAAKAIQVVKDEQAVWLEKWKMEAYDMRKGIEEIRKAHLEALVQHQKDEMECQVEKARLQGHLEVLEARLQNLEKDRLK